MKKRIALSSVMPILALAAGTALAGGPLFPKDTVVVQQVVSTHEDKPSRQVTLCSGNFMKIRIEKGDEIKETLVDFSTRKIWDIDTRTKKYRESNLDDLEKLFEQSFEGFRKLPADEQNKLRAQAQAMPPTKIDPTQEYATIAGFKARKYDVMIVNQKRELWASPEFSFPQPYYDLQELRHPLMGPRGKALRERMRELRQVEGFVLKQIDHSGRPEDPYTVTTETLKIDRTGKIPASEFEIPKGFTKATPPAAPASVTGISASPVSLTIR